LTKKEAAQLREKKKSQGEKENRRVESEKVRNSLRRFSSTGGVFAGEKIITQITGTRGEKRRKTSIVKKEQGTGERKEVKSPTRESLATRFSVLQTT